jgi:hypothetical protein
MSGAQHTSGVARNQQDSGRTYAVHASATDPESHGQRTLRLPLLPDAVESGSGDISISDQPPYQHAQRDIVPSAPDTQSIPDLIMDALPLGTAVPLTAEHLAGSEWLRLEVRGLIREFLSVVPRSKESTTLTFPRPDGTPRTVSRAQLSAAIDRMRPRQKHIIQLAVEERRSQEVVCALLNGISVRTLQRDQAEALDLLGQL